MIVDSHCHLDLIAARNQWSIDELVANAEAEGVNTLLSIGVDQPNSEQVVAIASRYTNVFATVGVHPCSANETPVDASWLATWAQKDKVLALGETGLDYYHEPLDKLRQHDSFAAHLALSAAIDKPVIVHTRNAREDTLAIIKRYQSAGAYGVMHCFTEDWDMARQALDCGYYISISGIVTFKNAEQVREVVRKVPLDRLLIETDSPYLAPVPFRGKTNQPAYVKYVAETCAALKGIDVAELAEVTTTNFRQLFKLPVCAL